MDSVFNNLNVITHLVGQRRFKAYLIGSLVLLTIVWLQMNRSPTPQPMVELFVECKLQGSDLNRIQLALGKAGLKDFQVRNHRLYVPQPQQLEYLQAVVDQNALPKNLDESQFSAKANNPFLTHTQQLSLQKEHRKKNLQELIRMLPFVDQAWLEMDDSNDRFAYRQQNRSAVVSVRPFSHQPLMEPQIATIRELVAGAVNGMTAEQIVVIDLDTGNAYRGRLEAAPLEKKWTAQRAKFARQKWIENQLRESLECYPGIEIAIAICGPTTEGEDKLADQSTRQPIPAVVAKGPDLASPLYGANGRVSLDDWDQTYSTGPEPELVCDEGIHGLGSLEDSQNLIAQVSFTTAVSDYELGSVSEECRIDCQPFFKITIGIPARLVAEGNFNSLITSDRQTNKIRLGRISQTEFEQRFESLKARIETRIAPVLEIHQDEISSSLDIHLIGIEEIEIDWRKSITDIIESQWPSLVVLLTGLLLIGLVGIGERPARNSATGLPTSPEQSADGDQLVTDSDHGVCQSSDAETEAIKARLSALIEKDPAAAARVIENWIRETS